MRLIDADRLKRSFEANTPIAFQDCVPGIHAVIDLERTVDAIPVIRCKDCKYFTRDTITGVTIPGTEYCIFTMNNRIEEDDYCSRAERKEK